METLNFVARTIYADQNKEDKYYMLGLADDPLDYRNYIITQRAFKYDTADIEQGVGACYFEVNGQENSAYNCVEKIYLSSNQLVFEINNQKIKGLVKVVIDISQVERTQVFDKYLSIIFEGITIFKE